MTTLKFRPEDFDSLSTSLRSSFTGIASNLADLKSQCDLLRTRWTGEASDAYVLAQAQWSKSLVHMLGILLLTERLVAGSGEAYAAVDADLVKQWPVA